MYFKNFSIKKDALIISASMLAISLGSMAAPVFAQDELEDLDLDAALEEVIVTAQRKSENIQDVPISMTVFSEEQIANANMTNAADLATLTPSLTVDTRFGAENTSFAIRGFYQSLRTTASVATYFAEVVAPRGQTSQTSGDGAGPGYLFDLQNVQVLKGPQGTLFGRNTTGGAILLTPNEPTDVFEGYVEGSAGNFDAKRLQAVVNVPLADSFRVRLGVDSNERDGHLNNVTGIGADELGSSNYTAVRLSALWDIVEGIQNYTILQHVDSDSTGYAATLIDCNPGAQISIFTYAPCVNQLAEQAAQGNDDFYDVASTVASPESVIKEKRIVNTTSFDVTDDITIKNIFGYAHLETSNGSAVFGTNFTQVGPDGEVRQFPVGASVVNPDYPVTSQETYVEEIQIQGTSLDESLDWQFGLYYENSRPDGYSGNNSAAFTYCDMASVEGHAPFDCVNSAPILGNILVQAFKTEFTNKAIYGQSTYDFTDELSMTLGLRYTMDKAEGFGIKERYTYGSVPGVSTPTRATSSPKVESEEPTGMIGVDYSPTKDMMTYAKYTRGYRQGSVNLAADSGLDEHDPETIDTYEIGAKTSFGGPIPTQLNFAVFYNELEDMQLQFGYVSPTSGPTTAITNAGQAKVKGLELDATLKLTSDLTLTLAYSHLNTELVEQGQLSPQSVYDATLASAIAAGIPNPESAAEFASNPDFIAPIAAEGDELPFAPKNTWVASLNYLLPVPEDMGVMTVGGTWVYMGEQRAASSEVTPYDMIDPYELLNLNASWLGVYGSNFDLSLYATNVTDKEYNSYQAGTWGALGFEVAQRGMPRMYGARVRYVFGG